MTQGQVDEAYQKYLEACTQAELIDMRHTEAQKHAYELQAELELCESRCSRTWRHYNHLLRALKEDNL